MAFLDIPDPVDRPFLGVGGNFMGLWWSAPLETQKFEILTLFYP